MTRKLVLLRHGQSQWNLENRFTGWVDVDLTDQGRAEARAGGELMLAEGLKFDCAHTSVLKRAIRTLMDWQIEVDEAMFLGGLSKGAFLREFEPDFFFDDQTRHVESAAGHVPAGHVAAGVSNEAAR